MGRILVKFGVFFFVNLTNFAKIFEKITKISNLKIEKKTTLLEIGYENIFELWQKNTIGWCTKLTEISELLVWPMPLSTYCNMG